MKLSISKLSRNYRAVVMAAVKRAENMSWPLEASGEFTVSATLSYLEFLREKARNGLLLVSTINSYMSALEAAHLLTNIKWKARKDFRVKFALKSIRKDKQIPQKVPLQNYEFTFKDLEMLCRGLDPSRHDDVITGALATCLFWAMGRVPELIHAKEHRRLNSRTVHRSPLGLWQILLERPKVLKDQVQILTPVESDGVTRANTWITLLIDSKPLSYSSPWQRGDRLHADTAWFYAKLRKILKKPLLDLGPSSFRAGGLTHLASRGIPLDHLQLLGRWESDAWKRYLRNHPWVLSQIIKLHGSSNRA
jgi:hypothetical protein